jgi:AcrR family transcriptional regulator
MAHPAARKGNASSSERPPSETARDRLLKAASALFFRYGINATGVDTIIEAANTAKATLYKSFGSKEGLIEAVLQAEAESWHRWFANALENVQGSPREKLVAVFDVLEEWFADEHFYGCPLINAVGEFDKKSARYKTLASAQQSVLFDQLTSIAKEAQFKEPTALAHQLAFLMNGTIVTALITGDPKVAQEARAAAVKIIDASE